MIVRCDTVEGDLGARTNADAAGVRETLDALAQEMRMARGPRPWLRLVDQGPGAAWAEIGSWQPWPAEANR